MEPSHNNYFLKREEKVELKLRNIVHSLRNRTEKVKNFVEQPPTPTDDSEDETEIKTDARELILDDFTESRYASKTSLAPTEHKENNWERFKPSGYIDPRGKVNIGLLKFFLCFIIGND